MDEDDGQYASCGNAYSQWYLGHREWMGDERGRLDRSEVIYRDCLECSQPASQPAVQGDEGRPMSLHAQKATPRRRRCSVSPSVTCTGLLLRQCTTTHQCQFFAHKSVSAKALTLSSMLACFCLDAAPPNICRLISKEHKRRHADTITAVVRTMLKSLHCRSGGLAMPASQREQRVSSNLSNQVLHGVPLTIIH